MCVCVPAMMGFGLSIAHFKFVLLYVLIVPRGGGRRELCEPGRISVCEPYTICAPGQHH